LLKRLLADFEISTVQEMGWTGVTNGALLRQAEDQFDVHNSCQEPALSTEPHRKAAGEGPASNDQVPVVALLAPAVQEVLGRIKRGEIVEIPLHNPLETRKN
jgi:hypothetical protein